MTASNVSREAIEQATREVGVRADIEALSASGRRFRVKLYPVVSPGCYTPAGHRRKGERGAARWQRYSASAYGNGRRVHAVCWHGFRAFFRAVYAIEPAARFKTAMAVYNGSDDFETVHPRTGAKNIGSAFNPVRADEPCDCGAY
jgi:hypothetical protein